MAKNIVKSQFMAADLTITANTTNTATPALSIVRCENLRQLQCSAQARGKNAGSSGVVTFNIASCVGDEKWSTDVWQTLTVTVAGTVTKTSGAELLNVDGLTAIRISSIVNGDAAQDIDTVNIVFSASVQ